MTKDEILATAEGLEKLMESVSDETADAVLVPTIAELQRVAAMLESGELTLTGNFRGHEDEVAASYRESN